MNIVMKSIEQNNRLTMCVAVYDRLCMCTRVSMYIHGYGTMVLCERPICVGVYVSSMMYVQRS